MIRDLALQAGDRRGLARPRNRQRSERSRGYVKWFAGICWQRDSGKGRKNPFVLVGVTGFEPVASAV
jgi:hypothetical protein